MIKTNHLLIKRIKNDDGQVTSLLADQLLLKQAHLTFSTQPVTSFEINLLLQSVRFMGIYQLKSPQKLIGLILLDQAASDLPGQLEIGYLLQQESWGQGIMTEAVAGVLSKLPQSVAAATDQNNLHSQCVLQKNGFSLVRQQGSRLIWQKAGLHGEVKRV